MGRDGLTTYHATWGVCGVREGFELGVGGERLRQLLVVKTIFSLFLYVRVIQSRRRGRRLYAGVCLELGTP